MKKLIGILLLLCALAFAVSCTREPNKLVNGKPGKLVFRNAVHR